MRRFRWLPLAALALMASGCDNINQYLYPTTYEKAHIIGVESPQKASANVPFNLTVWIYQPSSAYRLDPSYAPDTFRTYIKDGIITIVGECSYTPPKFGEVFPNLRLDPYVASLSLPVQLPYGSYVVSIAEGYYYKLPTPIVAITTKQAWAASSQKAQSLPASACSYFPLFYPAFDGEVDLGAGLLSFSVPALPNTWTASASNHPGFEFPPIQATATGSCEWPIRYISNAPDRPMIIN